MTLEVTRQEQRVVIEMAHGSIAKPGSPAVGVSAGHDIPDQYQAEIAKKVDGVLRSAAQPTQGCRVRLNRLCDPALDRPVVAQVNVNALGRPIRVQVTASTAHEAAELLAARLRRRLERIAGDDGALGGPSPRHASGREWRTVGEPTFPPSSLAGTAGMRRLVRSKVFEPMRMTPDDAAWEMDVRDFEAHLFTDAETGQDSVIYRGGRTGYRLAQLRPDRRRPSSTAVPLTVSRHPASILELAGAQSLLDATGHPFVFFVEPQSGRARLLYRRYDGHFGLVAPAPGQEQAAPLG